MAAIPRIDQKVERFAVPGGLGKAADRERAIRYLMGRRTDGGTEGEPLLKVRNLSKTFYTTATVLKSASEFKAVSEVGFDVFPGETLGIVGESGSGKSTVGRMILGLHTPDPGYEIIYRGCNIADLKSRAEKLEHRKSLQCIFQDPYSSLNPRMSAGENITYPLKSHGMLNAEEARQLAGDLMELVGLTRASARKMPQAFSGR